MVNNVDIIFGAAWGDEGKGKICTRIAKNYDYVCRWNGGPNAGHTFYVNEKKIVTHLIPSGVIYGIPSIIGPNCVIDPKLFFEELDYLELMGFNSNVVKVSPYAHVITNEHIREDARRYSEKIGTTAKGIGPCYADKALRIGQRAGEVLDKKWIWDGKLEGDVLCEGAQGMWLDINYGNYPYVTSSECLPYSACSLGFSPKKIRNIIAVAKMYDTRAGCDPDFLPAQLMSRNMRAVAKLGKEFGSTTGRPRSCEYLNLNKLVQAIEISGADTLYLNKGDILEELGEYRVKWGGPYELMCFNSMDEMKDFIIEKMPDGVNVLFDFKV